MKTHLKHPEDFNHLNEWLPVQLQQADLTVEQLADLCQPRLSKAAVYFWMADKTRPTEETMLKVCHALAQKIDRTVEDLYAEALSQYTPRKNGRPEGSGTGVRSVTVKQR